MKAIVSVVICLHNPGDFLERQIDALARQEVPRETGIEVIYVDNSSDARHGPRIERMPASHVAFRYVHEPIQGKCGAANRGAGLAQGSVLLFTDEDILPPPTWAHAMVQPIMRNSADVVAGVITVPDHLRRPDMNSTHNRIFMAGLPSDQAATAVLGANLAVNREIFVRIGGFDPDLGPGRLGGAEDRLFVFQARRLNARVARADTTANVEHHFRDERWRREDFLLYAEKAGRCNAYIDYHWFHKRADMAAIRFAKSLAGLWWLRLRSNGRRSSEGISHAEFDRIAKTAYYMQTKREQARAPNYGEGGVRKIRGDTSAILHSPHEPMRTSNG
jgi:glycosyltransferase involved in cell wall biosynthesis